MPWAKSDNAQDKLEKSLRVLLDQQTADPEIRRQLEPYLPPGIEEFTWAIEGEQEPGPPYGLLKKASQSRFGQGALLLRHDTTTKLRYREQWWRIVIELHINSDSFEDRSDNNPPLGAILNQLLNDLFMELPGRTLLADAGIYNIRLTDEGDDDEGNKFSFDCSTDRFIEEAPAQAVGAE